MTMEMRKIIFYTFLPLRTSTKMNVCFQDAELLPKMQNSDKITL